MEDGYIETILIVNLMEEEAKELGVETIELNIVVNNVFKYWEKYFEETNIT